VLDEFVTTMPGLALQVMVFKAMDQDLSLGEPRRMNRGKAWTLLDAGRREVVLSMVAGMAGITILDQNDALQSVVAPLEPFQRLDVGRGVFSVYDYLFDPLEWLIERFKENLRCLNIGFTVWIILECYFSASGWIWKATDYLKPREPLYSVALTRSPSAPEHDIAYDIRLMKTGAK
jgi:hypothetical protein